VIDIRMFRTTLLEIGNWVDADQSTGRIVHVPNGKVLTTDVFNATEGFGYLWHEIPVVITFESDWRRAEELVLESLLAVGGGTSEEAAIRIRRAARAYKIRYTHLTPTVYLTVRQSGVLLTGRLLVDTRRRRTVEQQIWRHLLEAFEAEPSIELAYPTTRFYTAAEVQAGKAAAVARADDRDHPLPGHPGHEGDPATGTPRPRRASTTRATSPAADGQRARPASRNASVRHAFVKSSRWSDSSSPWALDAGSSTPTRRQGAPPKASENGSTNGMDPPQPIAAGSRP
jgi:hypothetical protein